MPYLLRLNFIKNSSFNLTDLNSDNSIMFKAMKQD